MSDTASAAAPLEAAPRSVRSLVIGGASALGAVSIIERGCGFAANLLAARFAGAQVFGAYSLALTTANNVATYAGAGIGTTANRFGGRYRRGTAGYSQLVRSLTLVSVASAALAVLLLLAGAGPLARLLLRRPDLTPLLQVAAVSAGLMILLECLRGFLIGERLYRPLAVLALAGGAVVVALPLAARVDATRMLACQAAVSGVAMAICLAFIYRTPGRGAALVANEPSLLPSPGAIWRFGMIQFAGVIGLNAAGWWVAALVARADTTLTQSGLLAVASQLRNLTSLAPNLLTQSSYSLLADDGEGSGGRSASVLIYCTFVAALVSLLIGGTLSACAGWFLPRVLGPSYRGATLAVSLAMATAVVHMASAPASARLTMVSLRQTGLINGAWTVLTIVAATWLVPRWGAAAAMGVYFGVHCIAAGLVFGALHKADAMPAGVAGVLFSTVAAAAVLAGLAIVRAQGAEPLLSGVMLAVTAAASVALAMHGRSAGLLPRRIGVDNIKELFGRVVGRTA